MSRNRNPLLVQFASEPCLVDRSQGDRVAACLDAVMAHERAEDLLNEQAHNDDGFWPAADDWRAHFRPYVVKDGILHIPVKGVLLHNFPWALGNWATGYAYIQRAFERGMTDAGVKAVALIIDSPGGMVAGCFDALDKMIEAKTKPVRAFAHEAAYSAAYATAMVADHIAVSRTGGVGSIGVVTTHVDWSKWNEDFGLKFTFIFAGKHKVDGNPEEPLPDAVKARIQKRIDALYQVFVSAVARGRDMDEQAVRDTEALTFTAAEAVSNGLADSIGSLDDAVAAFAVDLDDQSDNQGENAMADEATQSAVDQAAQEAAVAAAREEGRTAGLAEGATAERTRVGAILGSEEAKGRESLANHFAFNTAMSADDAKAALAAAPVAAAVPAPKAEAASFEEAMGESNPEVGASPKSEENAEDDGSDVLALAAKVGIKGFVARKQS